MTRLLAFAYVGGLLICALPAGAVPDGAACQAAMTAAERGTVLPARLLEAIGMVESGRPGLGGPTSWPWTINVDGVGHFYQSKTEAMDAVAQMQATGPHSIDVGCMQISLRYHPTAFADLGQAFDPETNVRFGAAFLQTLHATTRNWAAAIAAYHSSEPARGQEYSLRVAAIWPLASAYALASHAGDAVVAAAAQGRANQLSVDPQHVATPEFRARLVAAAAFRRRRNSAMGLRGPAVGRTYAEATPRSAVRTR